MFTVNCIAKKKIKRKEAGNGGFLSMIKLGPKIRFALMN